MAGQREFRSTAADRMCYKVMHKFHDHKARFGDRHMCVGCGRYTRRCPEIIAIHATVNSEDEVLASVRVYREGRHGSQRWANLAAFSEATDLFRFRCIPGLTVTTDHFLICDDCRYDIVSVEDVKGRGMYIEVLAKKEVPTIG